MEENRVIATVNTLNESTNIKSKSLKHPVIQKVYTSDSSIAAKYFIKWASKLKSYYFEIKSNTHDLKVVFTIYPRTSENNIEHIIVVNSMFGDIVSRYSYKIKTEIQSIDIENMSDIISLVIRISTGDIPYFKQNSIINLIDFQMQRIAERIE